MTNKHHSILAAGIGFDENDLEAKRNGRLTRQQAERLLEKRKQSTLNTTWWLLPGGVVLGGLFLVGAVSTRQLAFAFLAGGVGLGLILYFRGVHSAEKRLREAIARGVVEAGQGAIQCSSSNDGKYGTSYRLRLGDLQFDYVSQEVYLAFRHLDGYTLYYLPQSKTIVSAEALSGE